MRNASQNNANLLKNSQNKTGINSDCSLKYPSYLQEKKNIFMKYILINNKL